MEAKKIINGRGEIGSLMLGTWAIGGRNWGSYNEKESLQALESSIDQGITGIDTSPVYGYGHAEELIGKVMGGRRSGLFLATKVGLDSKNHFEKNLSRAFLLEELHGSLKRLRTDYIDLYQCHWPDRKTPLEETMETLLTFQKEGKIRHIGLCNFPPDLLFEALQWGEIYGVQEHLSLLEEEKIKNLLPRAVEKDIRVLAYGTLEGGLLTGKYASLPVFGRKDVRRGFYKFYTEESWPRVERTVARLRELAEKHQSTPGAVAIAWALQCKGVTSVIAGARSETQVIENCSALDILLSEEECRLLASVAGQV